ncbi:MAG: methyltransferase domain-containing protein [Chlamydiales bacterium]
MSTAPISPINVEAFFNTANTSSSTELVDIPCESNYRRIFQTTEQIKAEFIKFLRTIFYQLNEENVIQGIEKILNEPNKTDKQIYTELLEHISGMKKQFAPLWKLWSLKVLKEGLGNQVATLTKEFEPSSFNDYMEIYDRRYLDVIRKKTKFPFEGKIISIADQSNVSLADRIQAGAIFSQYPYTVHIPLNDPTCECPAKNPEQTFKPISDEIPNKSIDLITCLGGLHHVSIDRLDPFIESMKQKLKPGAVLLLRDHNVADDTDSSGVSKEDRKAITELVHTFVNASDGIPWEIEKKEIREFKSIHEWIKILEKHGLSSISREPLVLKDDPTENGMLAFVRNPENLPEMYQAIKYRKDWDRGKDGTRATWIEWGNVRSSKQYSEFIQKNHSYAFDHIGHFRQHWKHFFHYVRECLNDDVGLNKLVFSHNFSMNLFILFTASIQSVSDYAMSAPSKLLARWKYGENWREVSNLTEIEKYIAQVEKDYSNFIDHTPFYMFDWIGRIRGIWETVVQSKEHPLTRLKGAMNALSWSSGMVAKSAISAVVKKIYTSEANLESNTVKVLIKDPNNELDTIINQWERAKNPVHEKNLAIEEIYSTPDGYKFVSFPRYRPFTKICDYISNTPTLEILKIGGQKAISVDLIVQENIKDSSARFIYEMERLQDPDKRHYRTYEVAIPILKQFLRNNRDHIEYIHE